jgi:YggT family protein
MLYAIGDLVHLLLRLYTYVIIAAVIASWLVSFGVINIYNHFARAIVSALQALTEPVFRAIRRIIPPMGGLDFSPLVVLVAVWFINDLLYRYGI